jgi:hypothetical protein
MCSVFVTTNEHWHFGPSYVHCQDIVRLMSSAAEWRCHLVLKRCSCLDVVQVFCECGGGWGKVKEVVYGHRHVQAVFLTVGLYIKFDEIYSIRSACVRVCVYVGRDTAVGIPTRYVLDGPGIAFRWVWDFPHPPRPPWGPPSLLYDWYWVSFPGAGAWSYTTHSHLVPRLKKE